MPTTAAGNDYSITSFTSSYGEPCRRGTPSPLRLGTPLVVFCHGNPGRATPGSADTHISTWLTGLREAIIDAGYAYVEGRGAGANWGNAAGRAAYEAMVTDYRSIWSVNHIVVVGQSMGALVGHWLASRSTVVSPRCAGFVSLSGTANLSDRYSTAGSSDKLALLEAYGATDEADFRAKAAAHDPLLLPIDDWQGRSAQQQYDTTDPVVPPSINALPWRDRYASSLAMFQVATTTGAGHDATVLGTEHIAATKSFLLAVSLPPPPPPTGGIVLRRTDGTEVGLARSDGTPLTLTPANA